jgi:hypothetical protein
MPNQDLNTFIESGYQRINRVYAVVETVSHFSELMHIILNALHMSLDSFGSLFFHLTNAFNFFKVNSLLVFFSTKCDFHFMFQLLFSLLSSLSLFSLFSLSLSLSLSSLFSLSSLSLLSLFSLSSLFSLFSLSSLSLLSLFSLLSSLFSLSTQFYSSIKTERDFNIFILQSGFFSLTIVRLILHLLKKLQSNIPSTNSSTHSLHSSTELSALTFDGKSEESHLPEKEEEKSKHTLNGQRRRCIVLVLGFGLLSLFFLVLRYKRQEQEKVFLSALNGVR